MDQETLIGIGIGASLFAIIAFLRREKIKETYWPYVGMGGLEYLPIERKQSGTPWLYFLLECAIVAVVPGLVVFVTAIVSKGSDWWIHWVFAPWITIIALLFAFVALAALWILGFKRR